MAASMEGVLGIKSFLIDKDMNSWTEGGAIYTVPAESFSFDPNKGLGQHELTVTQSITPISKEEFNSTLETMLSMGVQVYFIGKDILKKTRRDPEDLLEALENMQSENQKRNINIKPLRGG